MFRNKTQFVRYQTTLHSLPFDVILQKKYVDLEGEERHVGFVDFKDREDPKQVDYHRFQCTSFCVAKRSVPKKLLNKEFNKELKKTLKQFEETGEELPKSGEKAIREAVKNRMLRAMPSTPDYFDIVFDKETQVLYLFATATRDVNDALDRLIPPDVDIEYIGYGFGENEVDLRKFLEWVYFNDAVDTFKCKLKKDKASCNISDVWEFKEIEHVIAQNPIEALGIELDSTQMVIQMDETFKSFQVEKTEMDEDMIANVNDRMAVILEGLAEFDALVADYPQSDPKEG